MWWRPAHEHNVAAGDDDLVVAADGSHDHAVGRVDLADGPAYPFIPLLHTDLDKVDIVLVALLTDALEAGVLLHKACRDDAGGDGHHADTKTGEENAHDLACRGDGIDITVTHRQQRGDRPPHAGKGVGKNLGLGGVLQRVHTKADRQIENDGAKTGKVIDPADNITGSGDLDELKRALFLCSHVVITLS